MCDAAELTPEEEAIVKTSIPGLTSVLFTIGKLSEHYCKECNTKLAGLQTIFLSPKDAPKAFRHWAYITDPKFALPNTGEEVPVFAREWVDEGKVVLKLMDDTYHALPYDPILTGHETHITEKDPRPVTVRLEEEDFIRSALDSDDGMTVLDDLGIDLEDDGDDSEYV